MLHNDLRPTSRRSFLGALATTTAALSVATVAAPLSAGAKAFSENLGNDDDPEEWFKKLKGKHRMVFDVTQPHEILPFAWPRIFLMTNTATGTPEKEINAVVVLRHAAAPYALDSQLWAKYKLGDVIKAEDPATKAAYVRNPFWQPKAGDYKVPGIGNVAIGINELQDSGVMFCVCNVALTVASNAIAQEMNLNADDVKKDFMTGLLPGIQVMPSGVWAVGRAQEHGCSYCFAG